MNAVVFVPLTKNKVAIVDFVDFEKIRGHSWGAICPSGTVWYAALPEGQNRYLHHQILPQREGFLVDHKDRDGLNNTRDNLRYVTPQESVCNRRKPKHGVTSTFRGVSWARKENKWVAYIQVNRKTRRIGSFQNETDAARAYDTAARKYFGEFACPNFP